jgi:hypothetical protein
MWGKSPAIRKIISSSSGFMPGRDAPARAMISSISQDWMKSLAIRIW